MRRRKKSKWDDQDRPMDKRLYRIELEKSGGDGWYPVAFVLPRAIAERRAADWFLEYDKEVGVRIVPEVKS